jgi:hypothetical protein
VLFGFCSPSFSWTGFRYQRAARRRRAAVLRVLLREYGAPRYPHDRRPRFGGLDHRARDGLSFRSTPVTVVGLYWSFVDIVWIVLYVLIYLVGRVS